jgi:hypothetical protein
LANDLLRRRIDALERLPTTAYPSAVDVESRRNRSAGDVDGRRRHDEWGDASVRRGGVSECWRMLGDRGKAQMCCLAKEAVGVMKIRRKGRENAAGR